jgi:hypothetical protein
VEKSQRERPKEELFVKYPNYFPDTLLESRTSCLAKATQCILLAIINIFDGEGRSLCKRSDSTKENEILLNSGHTTSGCTYLLCTLKKFCSRSGPIE